MKDRNFLLVGLLVVLALILGACDLPSNTAEEQLSVGETMVALAFTQTAMAEPDIEEIEETTAPTPSPTPTEEISLSLTPTEETIEIIHGWRDGRRRLRG